MAVATLVRKLDGFQGDARLYRCDPPMPNDEDGGRSEYVVVSAARVPFSGPETYIFAADANGKVASWRDLPGSTRGVLDHAQALATAGYEVANA